MMNDIAYECLPNKQTSAWQNPDLIQQENSKLHASAEASGIRSLHILTSVVPVTDISETYLTLACTPECTVIPPVRVSFDASNTE